MAPSQNESNSNDRARTDKGLHRGGPVRPPRSSAELALLAGPYARIAAAPGTTTPIASPLGLAWKLN
jgi:hypothetical protein